MHNFEVTSKAAGDPLAELVARAAAAAIQRDRHVYIYIYIYIHTYMYYTNTSLCAEPAAAAPDQGASRHGQFLGNICLSHYILRPPYSIL